MERMRIMDSDRESERYMIFQKRIMNKILWVYENAPIFCIIGNEKFPIMQKTLREDAITAQRKIA